MVHPYHEKWIMRVVNESMAQPYFYSCSLTANPQQAARVDLMKLWWGHSSVLFRALQRLCPLRFKSKGISTFHRIWAPISPLGPLASAACTLPPSSFRCRPPGFLTVCGTLQAGSCLNSTVPVFPLSKRLLFFFQIIYVNYSLITFRSLQKYCLLIEAITDQPT